MCFPFLFWAIYHVWQSSLHQNQIFFQPSPSGKNDGADLRKWKKKSEESISESLIKGDKSKSWLTSLCHIDIVDLISSPRIENPICKKTERLQKNKKKKQRSQTTIHDDF